MTLHFIMKLVTIFRFIPKAQGRLGSKATNHVRFVPDVIHVCGKCAPILQFLQPCSFLKTKSLECKHLHSLLGSPPTAAETP